MDSILANINKKISNLRQNYEKMQSELCVSRQVSSKLGEQIVSLERQCWRNCQYSRRECLAVSGLPQSMENSRTGRHSFQVVQKTGCWNRLFQHWGLPRTKKSHYWIFQRKDANSIRRAEKNFKGMDLSSAGIRSLVYINDS